MKIYISGLYSGPNPSPGLGVARSLRAAFPQSTLIGVDYSNRSTGLHWPEFDDIWLQRAWSELDLEAYARQIASNLADGTLWLSGLDLEIRWLSEVFPHHPMILSANRESLAKTAKPAISAHASLPVSIPEYISTRCSDWELHTFGRRHDWNVWLKGPYYEARLVRSWQQLVQARRELSETWSTDDLFLQAHVAGYEESVAVCAFEGKLLDAVYMTKRELTAEGKTWAAHVSDVPQEVLVALRALLADMEWTGGAELEMVRTTANDRWLLEWNPRFPAWIHGSALAGHNLPAQLIAAATGVALRPQQTATDEFVRVVLELPARESFPLPPAPEPKGTPHDAASKHPSGMPMLARRIHDAELRRATTTIKDVAIGGGVPPVPGNLIAELERIDVGHVQTPRRIMLPSMAEEGFQFARRAIAREVDAPLAFRLAYSIKTDPDPQQLSLAYKNGYLAEAISQRELNRAIDAGFAPTAVILNGPGKWWPRQSGVMAPVFAVFCDSVAELDTTVTAARQGPVASVLGIRLRPPGRQSRFGVPTDDYSIFTDLLRVIQTIPAASAIGAHMHIASSAFGVANWWDAFEGTLRWAHAIETLAERPIEVLDLGGGWFPDDFTEIFLPKLERVAQSVSALLPNLRTIVIEPGKALVQSTSILAVRVLEVRREEHSIREIVVDGSIADLPEAHNFPHRVLVRRDRAPWWQPVGRGKGVILGRLCMEYDVLAAGLDLPEGIMEGDAVLICDAGAYDRSMSYAFGE